MGGEGGESELRNQGPQWCATGHRGEQRWSALMTGQGSSNPVQLTSPLIHSLTHSPFAPPVLTPRPPYHPTHLTLCIAVLLHCHDDTVGRVLDSGLPHNPPTHQPTHRSSNLNHALCPPPTLPPRCPAPSHTHLPLCISMVLHGDDDRVGRVLESTVLDCNDAVLEMTGWRQVH